MTTLTHKATLLLFVAMFGASASLEALAAKNDNRFQQSAEARHAKICAELQGSYDYNMNYYKEKPKQRGKWKIAAENLKTLAEGNDCSWAM